MATLLMKNFKIDDLPNVCLSTGRYFAFMILVMDSAVGIDYTHISASALPNTGTDWTQKSL